MSYYHEYERDKRDFFFNLTCEITYEIKSLGDIKETKTS